jgi:hypothetical protein
MKRLYLSMMFGLCCLASTAQAQTYGAYPTTVAPPTYATPGYSTTVYGPQPTYPAACCQPVPRVAYRPVVPVLPMPPSYEVGRGILGQPKLFVPGQPVRNFFRYLTP